MAGCTCENWTLQDLSSALQDMHKDNKRIVVPMFQRGKRWSCTQEQVFIDSLIKGYPAPVCSTALRHPLTKQRFLTQNWAALFQIRAFPLFMKVLNSVKKKMQILFLLLAAAVSLTLRKPSVTVSTTAAMSGIFMILNVRQKAVFQSAQCLPLLLPEVK